MGVLYMWLVEKSGLPSQPWQERETFDGGAGDLHDYFFTGTVQKYLLHASNCILMISTAFDFNLEGRTQNFIVLPFHQPSKQNKKEEGQKKQPLPSFPSLPDCWVFSCSTQSTSTGHPANDNLPLSSNRPGSMSTLLPLDRIRPLFSTLGRVHSKQTRQRRCPSHLQIRDRDAPQPSSSRVESSREENASGSRHADADPSQQADLTLSPLRTTFITSSTD